MKSFAGCFVLVAAALLTPIAALAQGTPTLGWSNLDGSAASNLTGGNYRLSGNAGQADAAVLSGGVFSLSGGFMAVPGGGGSVAVDPAAIPVAFAFHPPAPNPFTVSSVIELALPADGPVHIDVFGIDGRRVRTIADGTRAAGVHRYVWDGTDTDGHRAAAGIYFVRAHAAGHVATQRLVKLD